MAGGQRAGGATAVFLALVLVLGLAATARGAAWTRLERGRSGAFAFVVEARHSASAGLCLRVSVLDRHGPFSFERSRFRSCAAPGAELGARTAPLFAGGAQLSPGPGSGLSVFAALFAPAVHGAWLGLDDGGRAIRFRPLGDAEVGAGLGRVRLGVVVLDRAACPTRAISRGSGGGVLWDSGAGLGCGGFEGALEP
jgi:hypothetical protein